MNPNLDNLIIRLVPNEYIFAQDDDAHRISTIVNMVNNKVHGISESKLIKAVIFHILRETNFKTESLVPFLLVGIHNVSIRDLNTSTTAAYADTLARRLLMESDETDGMDKVNNVLSAIVDGMPIDLKENMTPAIKQAIVTYLLGVARSTMESFTDTPSPAPDTPTPSPALDTPTPFPSSLSDMLTPTPIPSSTPAITQRPNITAEPDYAYLRDQSNSLQREKNIWKYYMTATSSQPYLQNYNSSNSTTSSNNSGSNSQSCNNKPILAQYIDTQPELYVGRNDKVYIYDKTSNSLHYMPNDMQNISVSDLEKLLKQYEVSPDQIQSTLKSLYPQYSPSPSPSQSSPSPSTRPPANILSLSQLLTTSSSTVAPTVSMPGAITLTPTTTPTSAVSLLASTASSDTAELIDVIKSYQNEYVVTNYIVMSFLAFIVLFIIIYIIYKLYIYATMNKTK